MRTRGRRQHVSDERYWPSLDGVRAVAIVAVIAYHLGFLGGGWMGVDIFFVLSGFLITSLLRTERVTRGGIRLRAFWGRRARRLLPAVLLLLLVLCIYAWLGGPGLVPAQLRSPALATLFYVANWQQLIAGHNYFAAFTAPSPLQHTWSLAIEEQYYVVWPLLLGFVLLGRRRLQEQRTMVVTAGLVVASAVWMGIAAQLFGPNRAYLGTDTRAWELLLGGLAALCWRPGTISRRPRQWATASVLAAAGVGVGIALGTGPPAWAWDGGLVGVALCVAVVLVAITRAPGPLTRLLALRPVRWVGVISYSLYLWHWPTIVLLNAQSSGLNGPALLIARLATMTAAACASFYLVERPLRRANWRIWWRRGLVPVAVGATATAIVASTVAPATAASARTTLAADSAPTAPAVASLPAGGGTTADPWRVMIVGDSVMADATPGVAAAVNATGNARVVAETAFGGWGLTRDANWQADAETALRTTHPQIVVGTWSWDTQMAQTQPAAYEQLLRSYLSVLLSNGVDLVVLTQFPASGPLPAILDPAKQHAAWAQQLTGQAVWDREAHQVVQAFPGHAVYVQTAALFAPGDRFMAWLRDPAGQWIRARKIDNAHICPYGAAEFGALITRDLTPALHLGPAAPGWDTGSWTHDPRYTDPPGACPDDQPPTGYKGLALPVPVAGS
jgi:peptidoglycan/LPS O-acetylase OafA/YrhL